MCNFTILVSCLQNVVGSWGSKLFAVALLASGQSSTITGTYAGQYVMQVFANNSMQFLSHKVCIKARFLNLERSSNR